MRLLPSSLLLTALLAWSVAVAAPSIYVAYPDPNARVAHDHVLLEGSVTAGASLSVQGRAVDTGSDGLFIEWVPLKRGLNTLRLESRLNGAATVKTLKLTSSPPRTLPASPTAIQAGSVRPFERAHYFGGVGQPVQVSFAGSPGGRASFFIGAAGPFAMLEREETPGLYQGTYLLQPGQRWDAAEVRVRLTGRDGKAVSASAPGRLSATPSPQPRVGVFTAQPDPSISEPPQIARNGPGGAGILYPRAGTRLRVVGEEGGTYLIQIAPGQHVNLRKDQVRLLPVGAPAPSQRLERITSVRVKGGTQVRFHLPEAALYHIAQQAAGGVDGRAQAMQVRLYGVEAALSGMVFAQPDPLLRDLRWRQEQDGVFLAELDLYGAQQWGYRVFFEGGTLVLELRDPPAFSAVHRSGQRPLEGRKIALDPGHGGKARGAVGALRVDEKTLVLDIAQQAARVLRGRGAVVTLTRNADVDLGLSQRSVLARLAGAEVLVSIHANAIPDGVDPRTVRGAGAFYVHPHSRRLAGALLEAVTRTLPEVGNDGLHWQDLALARPTGMPQVLLETAYMVDKGNLRTLMSESGRERFAVAIADGLERFFLEAAQEAGG